MRAGTPSLLLFLALPACLPPIDLPTTCDEAFERIEPGERGPTLDREGPVEVGEELPVFRYRSDRSLAMTYGRSVALGCVLLDEEPRPNELLRQTVDAGLNGDTGLGAVFDAAPDVSIFIDGYDPIVDIELSGLAPSSEFDSSQLPEGAEDDGIGVEAAEDRARDTLARIVDAGLVNDSDLALVSIARTQSHGHATVTESFRFQFGYVPGGIQAFGPSVTITVDRDGPILRVPLEEADLTVESTKPVAIDEEEADSLLEAYNPQIQSFYSPIGPAWFPPSEVSGEESVQELRYYGSVSRGIRWISMMSPDEGVSQWP